MDETFLLYCKCGHIVQSIKILKSHKSSVMVFGINSKIVSNNDNDKSFYLYFAFPTRKVAVQFEKYILYIM